MQLPHHLEKGSCLAQDSGRQQMRLGEKRRRFQPPVLALSHHPLDVLLRDLEILQQHAFELVGAIRVFGHLPKPVQSQGHVALPNGLAKRGRPSKIAVRQLFNLA
jgi:hypothetical protein